MTSAADQMRAIKAKAMECTEAAVREGMLAVGERTIELTPIGDPTLWKQAPPADYRPGKLVSNWNFSQGAIDETTTEQTSVREVNGLQGFTGPFVGKMNYIANSLPYANAIDKGHSPFQAPVGILPILEIEAPDLATEAARKAAAR